MKFYLLDEMKNKYEMLEDGSVINKKTNKTLKYYTWKGRKFVSLFYQGKYYQYTEEQIRDFVRDKPCEIYKCKICGLCSSTEVCNFCQLKLSDVKKEVLKVAQWIKATIKGG